MSNHPLNSPDATYGPPSSGTRRGALVLAVLLIFILLGSLVFHLLGRSQYSQAVQRFQEELSAEVPNPTSDAFHAQVATLAPPSTPEAENAARWLVAGGKAMVLSGEEIKRAKEISRTPTTEWSAEQTAIARELVERNSGGIETLHRAAPLTGSDYRIDYSDLIHAEIPNLLELLNAAHLLNLDIRLALAAGEIEHALQTLATLIRLTDTLRREHVLICSLIAHATEKLGLQAIAEVLTSAEPSARTADVLNRLEEWIPSDDLLAFSKRMLAIDAAMASLSALEGREAFGLGTESRLRAYYFGHRQAARYLDQGRLTAALTYEPFAKVHGQFTTGKVDGYPGNLGPSYRNALAKSQLMLSQRRLVTAALALRQLGLEQGAYPTTCPALDVLTAPDPLVGKPLLCQPRGDGSLHLEVPEAAELVAEIARVPSLWILEIDLPAPSQSLQPPHETP